MDPHYSRDPWRELRLAPAWIVLATTWIALLAGATHIFHGAGKVVWAAGSVVLVAACVQAVRLLRAKDRSRQARLALSTLLVWAVGVLTVVVAGSV